MATKMSVVIAKRVKAIGLKANDEDHARKLLLEILESNGIDGMEDEDTETLIDIAESFVDEIPAEVEEAEAVEEAEEDEGEDPIEIEEETEAEPEIETEADIIEQLADEVEEEEEAEEEEEKVDELDSMNRKELKKFNKENKLGVRVKKSMTDDDLRDEIRSAMSDEDAEVEEEEEVEEPAKKEKPAKEAKEKKPRKIGKRGLKLHPKKVEEDRKHFKPLLELFPEEEFQYSWVASSGVTIKYKGENSRRAVALIESCSLLADGNVRCHLYLLTFTKKLEILDELGLDYSKAWNDDPYIKGIHLTEAIDILKSLMPHIEEDVSKIDNRLGVNRKKMEDSLKKTENSAKAEKVVKKAKA